MPPKIPKMVFPLWVRLNVCGLDLVESDVPELDDLLDGGMTEGIACVGLGPSGTCLSGAYCAA